MFLTYKKGLKLDGNNPTLLYGYGGFNISLPPTFSISKLQWCEMGGVYAQANIRGGGEYGKDWHQAAVKSKRQVAYDDFIAAAEWLIANQYTQTKKLAIQGGSNGGLLVGAVHESATGSLWRVPAGSRRHGYVAPSTSSRPGATGWTTTAARTTRTSSRH